MIGFTCGLVLMAVWLVVIVVGVVFILAGGCS